MSNAHFAAYYERRLIDGVNGRLTQNHVEKRYQPAARIIPVTDIKRTGDFSFEVVSATDRSINYTVDMTLSVCTCHVGMTGAPWMQTSVGVCTPLQAKHNELPNRQRHEDENANDANGNWRH